MDVCQGSKYSSVCDLVKLPQNYFQRNKAILAIDIVSAPNDRYKNNIFSYIFIGDCGSFLCQRSAVVIYLLRRMFKVVKCVVLDYFNT